MNAKIAKSAKVGRRVRLFVRWGVWVCTGLLIAIAPFSIWMEPGWEVEFVPKQSSSKNRQLMTINLIDGIVMWQYYPNYNQMYFGGSPEPGWHHGSGFHRLPFPPMHSNWWSRPQKYSGDGSGGPNTRIEFPLMYPIIVMIGLSAWLMYLHRNRHIEGNCRYSLEGLSGGVCPECGEAYGEA